MKGRQDGQEGEGQQDPPLPPPPLQVFCYDNKRQQLVDPQSHCKGSGARRKAKVAIKQVYTLFTNNRSTKTVPVHMNSVADHTALTSTTELPSTDELMRLRKDRVTDQHKSLRDAVDAQAACKGEEKELKKKTAIKEQVHTTSATA